MRLYNTLTRQVDEIQPLSPPKITVYTCGPTVYDYAHIGHWYNYVRMDTLIRTLKAASFNTDWVMNITDVGHLVSDADEGEDKLEKGARREGKSAWEIAAFYTKDFMEGMRLLNILTPDHIVKATDHINQQIDLIKILEDKGYTYIIDDGVYYDTSLFPGYASFALLDLDEQQSSSRVNPNLQKKNPSDFALWKFSPKDRQRDMEWDSRWGKGFPGWHIECSAMSMHYLGPTLDIHTGGIDHIPTHHTNEIAQSESATGKRFANYWLHSNHVMIEGAKISKSLGNGIRLQDIIAKGISPEAVRLHILESHYRKQSKFTWESLEAADNRLRDLRAMAALRWQLIDQSPGTRSFSYEDAYEKLKSFLTDDLNTPRALAYLSQVITSVQDDLVEKDMGPRFEAMLKDIDSLLGLNLMGVLDICESNKRSLQERSEARANDNWPKSDSMRDQLEKDGIGLRDTPLGTIWFPLK